MSWHERLPDGSRKRRTGFVGTLTQARAEKAAARVMASTRVAEPQAHIPTLYEYARSRFADPYAPRVQHGTDRYETAYRLRIHQYLGSYRLDALTPTIIRDWCDGLVQREGDRRCGHYAFGTLLWLLNEAVDDGVLEHNAAAGIRFAKRAKTAVRQGAPSAKDHACKKPTLTREQYEQVKGYAATVSLRDLVMLHLAVEGCLRRAELAGLRWGGLDADARTFDVANGVTHTRTTGTVLGDLKNRPSQRQVVLCEDLCRLLGDLHADADDDHFLFPGGGSGSAVDSARPQVPNSISKRVSDLVRRAGVVDAAGRHYTDLQGLRATGASLAAAAGVPTAIIEAQLGHAGSSVFERHYRDVRLAPERFAFADVFQS